MSTYDKSWVSRCSIRIWDCKLIGIILQLLNLYFPTLDLFGSFSLSLSGLFCFSTFPVEFVRQLVLVVGILGGVLGNNKVESTFCKIWKYLGRSLGEGDLYVKQKEQQQKGKTLQWIFSISQKNPSYSSIPLLCQKVIKEPENLKIGSFNIARGTTQTQVRESLHCKKVTNLWTLSLLPLVPCPSSIYRHL